jgi:hypothetical protein
VKTASSGRTIAFLGDYLPRKCSIATLTYDLLGAEAARHPQDRCFAVPVNDIERRYRYPAVVRFEIEEQDLASYRPAADFLNSSDADIISLQHEFGIFGGPAGSHILSLPIDSAGHHHASHRSLHAERRPASRDEERDCDLNLAGGHDRAGTNDFEVYYAPPAKIDLIPHGIPDVPLVARDRYRDQFGLERKEGIADVWAAVTDQGD